MIIRNKPFISLAIADALHGTELPGTGSPEPPGLRGTNVASNTSTITHMSTCKMSLVDTMVPETLVFVLQINEQLFG